MKDIADHQKAFDARQAKSAVPAGGGREGEAYLAYRQSIGKLDGTALLAQISVATQKEIATQMQLSGSIGPSDLESWAFMKKSTFHNPVRLQIVGGLRADDATTLELEKTAADGKKSFGTARLIKESGQWKVANEVWSD